MVYACLHAHRMFLQVLHYLMLLQESIQDKTEEFLGKYFEDIDASIGVVSDPLDWWVSTLPFHCRTRGLPCCLQRNMVTKH